jgi:ribitol-5-phosphate 2-dehydrogenase (NADP+) / D-ribitol-5-phosphate cytidylyltransferase
MKKKLKNLAVILAGGTGQRFGAEQPKQFLKVAGKMVIEHTLDVFQAHPEIDEIAVVTGASHLHVVEGICNKNGYDKVKKVLCGGQQRYESSLAAINAYDDDEINVIFHDAVRPLVNGRIISDCIRALDEYQAVDVGVNTTDTIISVNERNEIKSIPVRAELRNGQTPQAFKLRLIRQGYERALADPSFTTTDDCGVVLRYLPGVPIYVVQGEESNMKITYKDDLFLVDKLFQLRARTSATTLEPRAEAGIEGSVVVVFGGTYGIGQDIVEIAGNRGAKVYSFSRSLNGVDIADRAEVARALAEVYQREERIDVVVNTAGILHKEPLVNMAHADILEGVNVNYLGAINVAKESFPYLRKSKGSLLLFTSSSYTRGRSHYSVYSSSNAAIVNLVQALGEEWNEFGVRVNCMNPERTNTPMRVKNFGVEAKETLLDSTSVAAASINTFTSPMTGQVVDVRLAQ